MKIEAQVQAGGVAADARLTRSLQQFESMLTTQILSPLMKSSEEDEGGGTDGAAAQIRQTAIEALASAMSARGGIGIAKDLAPRLQALQNEHASAGPKLNSF